MCSKLPCVPFGLGREQTLGSSKSNADCAWLRPSPSPRARLRDWSRGEGLPFTCLQIRSSYERQEDRCTLQTRVKVSTVDLCGVAEDSGG